MDALTITHIRNAQQRVRDMEQAQGFVGQVDPLNALQSFAKERSLSNGGNAGFLNVEAYHPLAFGELVQDFAGAVGHACDSIGADARRIIAAAMGLAADDLEFVDDELDEMVEPQPFLAGWAEMADANLEQANWAKAALLQFGSVDELKQAAVSVLRHVRLLAEDVGLDAEHLMLAGFGVWSGERMSWDPPATHVARIARPELRPSF